MEPFRFHLFVCTQQKPEGVPSCPASGSLAVLEGLDREVQKRGLGLDVQLTTCGCTGLCDEGPVMIVYPEGVWYRRVQSSDVSEIVDAHLLHDKPVNRLVWKDGPAMRAMSIEHGEKFRAAMAAREKAGTLPDRLDQMVRGYMPSRCILTALELDIFTAIGEGANAEQIGTRIHANARAAEMLLNALVALGLVTKSGGIYQQHARVRALLCPKLERQSSQRAAPHREHLASLEHTDRRRAPGHLHSPRYHMPPRDSTPEWTLNFIAGMDRNAKARAPLLVQALGTAGVRRILDLGGGSGAYSIAFAKASTNVRCEILDVPEVVPLTTDYVNKAGVSAQVSLRSGDMLTDDLGSGYDIIMLNAICHMFSEEQNQQLFRRARQALAPNGRLVVQDFILNSDKTGPLHAALFSLNMLVATDHGASYSETEYSAWMKNAGLVDISRIKLPGPSQLIVGLAK